MHMILVLACRLFSDDPNVGMQTVGKGRGSQYTYARALGNLHYPEISRSGCEAADLRRCSLPTTTLTSGCEDSRLARHGGGRKGGRGVHAEDPGVGKQTVQEGGADTYM